MMAEPSIHDEKCEMGELCEYKYHKKSGKYYSSLQKMSGLGI